MHKNWRAAYFLTGLGISPVPPQGEHRIPSLMPEPRQIGQINTFFGLLGLDTGFALIIGSIQEQYWICS